MTSSAFFDSANDPASLAACRAVSFLAGDFFVSTPDLLSARGPHPVRGDYHEGKRAL